MPEVACLIIVPVHNEKDNIESVSAQLEGRDPSCDVVYVNDGSEDESGRMLEALGVNVIHHPVNLGYLETLRTGLVFALKKGYDFVAFFDGDGQHRVKDLNLLVEHHRDHPEDEVLVGSRYLSGQQAGSWLRYAVGRAFAMGVRLATSQTVNDVTSGLKLLNRRAITVMQDTVLEDGHAEFFVFMARAGCRIRELPIQVEGRQHGSSMYRFSKVLVYPFKTAFLLVLAMLPRAPSRISQ